MKKVLTLIMLSSSFSVLGLFSVPSVAGDSETPKYTDEQLQKLQAAEEKYKDNPQIMNMINKLKEHSGITDSVVEEKESGPPPVMAHGKVITHGSYQDADAALRDNDMETTIANYKIMAEEGDTEVSVKLGYIYETEGNTEAAYAAYKQAAESEDNNEAKKMALERIKWLDKNVMNDKEVEQGASGTKAINNTNQLQYRPITASTTSPVSAATKPTITYQATAPRQVIISPERISKVEHFKPEKFHRLPEG